MRVFLVSRKDRWLWSKYNMNRRQRGVKRPRLQMSTVSGRTEKVYIVFKKREREKTCGIGKSNIRLYSL